MHKQAIRCARTALCAFQDRNLHYDDSFQPNLLYGCVTNRQEIANDAVTLRLQFAVAVHNFLL